MKSPIAVIIDGKVTSVKITHCQVHGPKCAGESFGCMTPPVVTIASLEDKND